MNILISGDTGVAIVPLIFFKAVNGTHTLTLIMDQRKDVGVLFQELFVEEEEVKITLELMKQSIVNTDARQMTIPPHSGGLENSKPLSLVIVPLETLIEIDGQNENDLQLAGLV